MKRSRGESLLFSFGVKKTKNNAKNENESGNIHD